MFSTIVGRDWVNVKFLKNMRVESKMLWLLLALAPEIQTRHYILAAFFFVGVDDLYSHEVG